MELNVHCCVHKGLPPIRYIQCTPSHHVSLGSIPILSSHLRLVLLNVLLTSGLPTKILYAFHISPASATCPTHLILLAFITVINICWSAQFMNISLCCIL